MSAERKDVPRPAPHEPPADADSTSGSGKGASTALEALIRKRRQVESHEDPGPDTMPPAAPAG